MKQATFTVLETNFCETSDITFITRYTWREENGEHVPVSTECVGFYYGKPNATDTERYAEYGLKATF